MPKKGFIVLNPHKSNKLNVAHNTMKTLYKNKDVDGLKEFAETQPKYAMKAMCYYDRLIRKNK